MIKFFSKIRQHTLSQDKFIRYILYAFGEIILVVIGILIALQINMWNENRKNLEHEQMLLKDLQKEIKTCKEELLFVIKEHEKSLAKINTLIKIVPNKLNFSKNQDSTLYYISLLHTHATNYTYDPKLGTLKSIINSGKIDFISNSTLKYKLASLIDLIVDVNESTNQFQYHRSPHYFAILNKFVNIGENGSMEYKFNKLFKSSEFRLWLTVAQGFRTEGLEEEYGLVKELDTIGAIIESDIIP